MVYDFNTIFDKILKATDDALVKVLIEYEEDFRKAETEEELAAINSMISEIAEMYGKATNLISDCGFRLRNKQI